MREAHGNPLFIKILQDNSGFLVGFFVVVFVLWVYLGGGFFVWLVDFTFVVVVVVFCKEGVPLC